MIVALRHLAGLFAVGALLWFLWRRFDCDDRRTRWIVASGFLIRALPAEALFWISYLRLPILRPYQLGRGFWFFALDGTSYMSQASEVAAGGFFHVLVEGPPLVPNVYVRTLTAFVWLLGDSAAVGSLLNLLAYLGGALIIARWTSNRLPLIAISLAPAAIIWSLQPLKDAFFTFLMLLFFFVLWRFFVTHRWPYAIALMGVAAALASIRWYFGVILVSTACVGLAVDALRPKFRPLHVVTSAAMVFAIAIAAALGAGDQVPMRLRPSSMISAHLLRVGERTRDVAYTLELVRDGFDATGGGTAIRPGRLISRAPEPANTDYHLNYARMVAESKPLPRGLVWSRLVTGVIVIIVPHAIANPIGLTDIGGGRGLWWLADTETLVFDAVAVLALLAIIRAIRERRLRNPLLWQLTAMAVLLTLALAYAVTNFGTLFRHRDMVFVALLGIVLSFERGSG